MTTQQVLNQEQNYNTLLAKTNLVKLGRLAFSRHNIEDGVHTTYNFIMRYLSINGIKGAMVFPSNTNESYHTDMQYRCLTAALDSFK